MTNIDYKLWPNAGGNLGQIKVQIPTGAADDPWPAGDALVHNFVFNKSKLVGFVDTKALIANGSKITTFPYDYVNISLPSITEGEMTYNYDQCTYVVLNGEVLKGDVPTNEVLDIITKKYAGCKTVDDIKAVDPNYLTNDIVNGVWKEGLADLTDGYMMFRYCPNLTSFNGDLSSLMSGTDMFFECYNLTAFNVELPCLTDGTEMFRDCTNLKSFSSDLSSLTNSNEMFEYCTKLTSFISDLPSLTFGMYMFNGCSSLTSFNADLSILTDGNYMFQGCYNLKSFSSDLSNLRDGWDMFSGCKLDTPSVQNIADTINTVSGERHLDVWIGNSSPNEQETAAFNKIASKGWTVYVNGYDFGSSSCSSCCSTCCASLTTLDETDGEFVAPIPYWAKPVPSDEEHAQYTDSEGNFYNILGAQFIYGDDLSTYGMFTSLEDAAANMRLKKIGEEEIETA